MPLGWIYAVDDVVHEDDRIPIIAVSAIELVHPSMVPTTVEMVDSELVSTSIVDCLPIVMLRQFKASSRSRSSKAPNMVVDPSGGVEVENLYKAW